MIPMASKGAQALLELVRGLYGNIKVVEEHHLGERLRLDYYIPLLDMGLEYHGRQHREFVKHFHGSEVDFQAAKRRDSRKAELCLEQGIALITVWFDEKVTAKDIMERYEDGQREVSSYQKTVPNRDGVGGQLETSKSSKVYTNASRNVEAVSESLDRREQQKQYRKEQRDKYNQSDDAQRRRDEAKRIRREQYQAAKLWKKNRS